MSGTAGEADAGPAPVRVLLVDDQALVRLGFRMLLDGEPGLLVVGEAADGAQAVAQAAALAPDVVLMDVRMPVLDGVEATRRITAAGAPDGAGETGGTGGTGGAGPRVLVVTTFDLDEHAFAALRAGASGFLLKDAQPAELLAAVRAVAAGDAVVSPRVTRQLLRAVEQHLPGGPTAGGAGDERAALAARVAALTEREREVLARLARGATNAEVAAALVLSEATVKGHVGRLLAKLGARDRVQLVVLAFRAGLVDPYDDGWPGER